MIAQTKETHGAAPRFQPADWRIWLEEVDRCIGEILERDLHPALSTPSLEPLYRDLAAYVRRPGKRVRPLLFLLGTSIFPRAQQHRREDLLRVAAALELLHAFILVHDDLIDRSDTRRGLPSLHRLLGRWVHALEDRGRHGASFALVLGDLLFAAAQKAILQTRIPARADLMTRLLGYIVDTGAGELEEIAMGARELGRVSLPEIERMYLLKTSRYTIECPLVMAGLLAGLDEDQMGDIAAVAEPAGLAFQIENDLQEFERFMEDDGAFSDDLVDGKKTALLRTAYGLLGEADRALLQVCLGARPPNAAALAQLRDLVLKSGAVEHLRGTISELFDAALRRADQARFDAAGRRGLGELLRLVGSLTRGGGLPERKEAAA